MCVGETRVELESPVSVAVLSCTRFCAKNASGIKMQTAPLLTIIVGLVISAIGVFWHVHTVRTDSAAVPRSVAPAMEQHSKDEGRTAPDIVAKSTGGDSSAAPDDAKTANARSQQVDRPPDPAMQATTT